MNKIINKIMMLIVLLTVYIPTHSMEMRVTRSGQKRSAEVAGLIINDRESKKTKLNNKTATFICALCNKNFSSNHNLIIHQRTHTGEKSYSCDICYRIFATRSNLVVHHIRTHMHPIVPNDARP